MAYNALYKMREINQSKFGIDSPNVVRDLAQIENVLTREGMLFIRDDCEDLRFQDNDEIKLWNNLTPQNAKKLVSAFSGKSTDINQIPYNMQMDNDRLVLENCIYDFMETGASNDAFKIYFCYLEIFFGGYSKSRRMIEMLAEFEINAGSLLMKHRDHYVHSVYVFIMGLAIFRNNSLFRDNYKQYYNLNSEKQAAHHFLQYWGASSLFHDIGYPFELAFEQIKTYFSNETSTSPYVAYKGINEYIELAGTEGDIGYYSCMVDNKFTPQNLNEIIAYNLSKKMKDRYSDCSKYLEYHEKTGCSYYEYILLQILGNKPSAPEMFNGYMDHAYFSALILFKDLLEILGAEKISTEKGYLDVITAIILHNSIYKFSITNIGQNEREYKNKHKLSIETHPLAYLLMLCDELQCWDRINYGQNSRNNIYPINADFEFIHNTISVCYSFADDFAEFKDDNLKKDKVKNYHKKIQKNIDDLLLLNEEDTMQVIIEEPKISSEKKNSKVYLSSSNFLHIYNFAVALNAKYEVRNGGKNNKMSLDDMEELFSKRSLEYQISNISQAKAFDKYLDMIGCFYTDRLVENKLKVAFDVEELEEIAFHEHNRWWKEKETMAWGKSDGKYKDLAVEYDISSKIFRECTKSHTDMVPLERLSSSDKAKDVDPMNDMIRLLYEYDGLRIYKL